jgi:hypothetical protein
MDNLSISLPNVCCSDEDSTPVSEDNHFLERNEGKENSPPEGMMMNYQFSLDIRKGS